MDKSKKGLGCMRKYTFFAYFSLSFSIILITIGIANCLEKSVVYWIGGGLTVLPITCFLFYQAKKSEEDKIIKELQELSKTKHN